MGSMSLLQNVTLSSQPISAMDLSPDKVCTCVVHSKCTVIHDCSIRKALLLSSITVMNCTVMIGMFN